MIHSTSHRVIVQETHGNWAGLLRHQLAADTFQVIRVESLDPLTEQLESTRWAFFALQFVRQTAIDHLGWLRDAARCYPHACFCGIISDGQTDAWAVYEAGASRVIRHPVEVPRLARLVRRYYSTRPQTSPAGSESTIESVWLSLPWCDHATPAFDTRTNRED